MKIEEFNQMMEETFGDRVINVPSTSPKKKITKNEKQKFQTVALTGQPMIEWMMSRFNWTEKEALNHIAQQKNFNK